MSLLHLIRRIVLALLACLPLIGAARAREVVDIAGRHVDVPDKVTRVVLGEGRLVYALALLDRADPFQRVVGWQNDFRLMDPHTFASFAAKYPEVEKIPLIGQSSEQSVSAERILSLRPDLVVLSLAGHGLTEHSEVPALLAQAGIPVIFVDFRINPLANTPKSIALLGKALGREKEASEYVAFYESHLKHVTDAIAAHQARRPKVFLELLAGVWQSPGHTTGKGGVADMIAAAGGDNIAAGVVPGALGDISVEAVLHADPDIYIASGNRAPGLLLGANVSEADAKTSFAKLLDNSPFRDLRAIRTHRVLGVWHDFYNSPYNILLVEALAKAIHPELFGTLDPKATLHDLDTHYLDAPQAGTYWVSAP
jgi:iron complex transport system substrate-binding protein